MIKTGVRLYAVVLAVIGCASMIFFFPSAKGCSDFATCLAYSISGMAMLALGVGIFFLKDFARKGMIMFAFVFAGYFIFETVWLLRNDPTGQGLVGMVLLGPILIVGLVGLIFFDASACSQGILTESRINVGEKSSGQHLKSSEG